MRIRVLWLLAAASVAAVVLAAASAASVETTVSTVRYLDLNANCPSFTTPTDVDTNGLPPGFGSPDLYLSTAFTQTREWGTVPSWIRKQFPWIGTHATIITTVIHAEGVDGADVGFVVDGTFVTSEAGFWPLHLGAYGDYGRGQVKIVREDGAKVFERNASLSVPSPLAIPGVGVRDFSSVTCAGHRST